MNISAGFISPGTNCNSTSLAITNLHIHIVIVNLNVLSTALLHSITGNEDGALAVTIDWDKFNLNPKFLNQGFLIQITCLEQSEIAIYLASVEDRVMVFWAWDLHEIMLASSLSCCCLSCVCLWIPISQEWS